MSQQAAPPGSDSPSHRAVTHFPSTLPFASVEGAGHQGWGQALWRRIMSGGLGHLTKFPFQASAPLRLHL